MQRSRENFYDLQFLLYIMVLSQITIVTVIVVRLIFSFVYVKCDTNTRLHNSKKILRYKENH